VPFGLKTAPAVFQRFMDEGLSEYLGQAVWYIDDILVMGESRAELARNELLIRDRLRAMGCTINEDKSETNLQTIEFVGLVISAEGLGMQAHRLQLLRQFPAPSTKAEAQSALGLVSYLRDFIPLVAHFTARLYPDKFGLRMDKDAYEVEWHRLVGHIMSASSITHHWREGVTADLYTDASQYALGAVVLQEGRLVAVAARKLTTAEQRYSATDREHLGLVFAAIKFRTILHQSNATTRVWSDHSALVTRKNWEMTPRQARWHTIVTQWMPNVRHVPGKNNPADFISRWKGEGLGGRI